MTMGNVIGSEGKQNLFGTELFRQCSCCCSQFTLPRKFNVRKYRMDIYLRKEVNLGIIDFSKYFWKLHKYSLCVRKHKTLDGKIFSQKKFYVVRSHKTFTLSMASFNVKTSQLCSRHSFFLTEEKKGKNFVGKVKP